MERKLLSVLGAVVVVVAAVVSGGCGGSSGSSAKSESTAATTTSSGSGGGTVVKTVTVHETEYKLSPSSISLAKTGTYVFKGVNDGSVDHALAVEGNGIDQDGMDIAPGSSGTLKVTISKAGKYEIYCPIDGHKDMGMEGTITVGSGGSSGGTSTEDTTTSSGSSY
jgi:uncharacterized cupredoxin-like copper-binding protein